MIKNWLYERHIKRAFYGDERFKALDVALQKRYRKQNPYRLCRTYWAENSDAGIYGETPLSAFYRIAHACQLDRHSVFVDLGAGRGRLAFFLQIFFDCTVLAIEKVPDFIQIGRELARDYACQKTLFIPCELTDAPLMNATHIYLYGTTLSDAQIEQLINRFLQLNQTPKILTVSFPLSDYDQRFKTKEIWSVPFLWGEGDIYLNEVEDGTC